MSACSGFVEDVAAVDDAQIGVHAQPQAFDGRGEVPGIDELAVDRGLTADRVEPGAVEEGLGQGMTGQRLVEPGDGGGGPGERRGEHMGRRGRPAQVVSSVVEHVPPQPPVSDSAVRRGGTSGVATPSPDESTRYT